MPDVRRNAQPRSDSLFALRRDEDNAAPDAEGARPGMSLPDRCLVRSRLGHVCDRSRPGWSAHRSGGTALRSHLRCVGARIDSGRDGAEETSLGAADRMSFYSSHVGH